MKRASRRTASHEDEVGKGEISDERSGFDDGVSESETARPQPKHRHRHRFSSNLVSASLSIYGVCGRQIMAAARRMLATMSARVPHKLSKDQRLRCRSRLEVEVKLTPTITHVSVKSQNLKAQFRSLEIRIIRHKHLIFHDLLVNRNMDRAACTLPSSTLYYIPPAPREARTTLPLH